MSCPNCGHAEHDHEGHWSDGQTIPGYLCYHMENQGYSEDLCPCPGYYAEAEDKTYFETVLGKAGLAG